MPTPTDDFDRRVLDDVDRHGWSLVLVPDEDDSPPFAFTVGLFHKFQHPELVLVGLPLESAAGILTGAATAVRDGRGFEPGSVSEGLLEGFAVTWRTVPTRMYPAYLGCARWFYEGDAFGAIQLVYPDHEHRWPWTDGVHPGFARQQTVLEDASVPPWSLPPVP